MIGILALHGGFLEHEAILRSLGLEFKRVVEPDESLTGLIIPGGESTVMDMFMQKYNWIEFLKEKVKSDPEFIVYGTCAGLILLARYGFLDAKVERNAYGTQINSFIADLNVKNLGTIRASFIRAPKIIECGKNAEILCEYDGDAVLIRQKNIWGGSFHPELCDETALHRHIFLK